MKKRLQNIFLLSLTIALLAAPAFGEDLGGDWTLNISNYKNSCGGDPTASRDILLVQSGKSLTATIQVKGDDGKMYKGTFHGSMDNMAPPCNASLYGKFDVGSFTTEETIDIRFLNDKIFAGNSRWETTSSDKKIKCLGTQDVKGTKK